MTIRKQGQGNQCRILRVKFEEKNWKKQASKQYKTGRNRNLEEENTKK